MNLNETLAYNSDLVVDVFGPLSIDKTRQASHMRGCVLMRGQVSG